MSDETQVLDEPLAAEAPPAGPPDEPAAPAAALPEPEGSDGDGDAAAASERIAALEESLALIAEAEAEVSEAEAEWEAAKKRAASRKKDWESAVMRLQKAIRDRNSGQMRLPLDKPAAVAAAPAESKTPETDDAWRDVLLTTLELDERPLPPSLLDALAERDLLTVGDLADWSAPRPAGQGQRLIDIPGIGPGKAEQIEQALEQFWTRRALDAREAINAELVAGVREAEAAKAEAASPLPDRPELTEANAWRVRPVADLGLDARLVEALEQGGLHCVQDVAFGVLTDYVDTLPGIAAPEDLAAVRDALERFRQTLPDDQAFDFAEFEASQVPSPADEQPVTESAARKRTRKTREKAAPTA